MTNDLRSAAVDVVGTYNCGEEVPELREGALGSRIEALGKVLEATKGEAATYEFVDSLPFGLAYRLLAHYVALHRWFEDQDYDVVSADSLVEELDRRLRDLGSTFFPSEEEYAELAQASYLQDVFVQLGKKAKKIHRSEEAMRAFAGIVEKLADGFRTPAQSAVLVSSVLDDPGNLGTGIYYDFAAQLIADDEKERTDD